MICTLHMHVWSPWSEHSRQVQRAGWRNLLGVSNGELRGAVLLWASAIGVEQSSCCVRRNPAQPQLRQLRRVAIGYLGNSLCPAPGDSGSNNGDCRGGGGDASCNFPRGHLHGKKRRKLKFKLWPRIPPYMRRFCLLVWS